MLDTPLFNPKTICNLCENVVVTEEQKKAAHEWLELLRMGNLKDEKKNYIHFCNIILDKILGYSSRDIGFENMQSEFILQDSEKHPMVCVEVKGSDADLTKRQYRKKQEHSTPIQQLWNYMGASNIQYGICTNYVEFHLMRQSGGFNKRHVFDIRQLQSDMSKLREFIGMFSQDRIEAGFIQKASDMSEREEQDITDKFYTLYGNTRLMLIREFESCGGKVGGRSSNDEEKNTITLHHAVDYAQMFLNRVIFILFAEAHDLIERKHISLLGDITRILDGPIGSRTKKLWRHMTDDLFDWLDKGSDDPAVFGFNGGLFRNIIPPTVYFPDKRVDSFFDGIPHERPVLKVEQQNLLDRHSGISPLIVNLMAIASYDFRSEIRVTILGHIFEHSIQEIDTLLGGGKSLRRKLEGVFYTPDYITRYICRNVIIPYLSKSGHVTRIEDLVSEYSDDIVSLEERLNMIKILDPACGSGAFLIEAIHTLLEIHRAVWDQKVAVGGEPLNELSSYIEEARVGQIVKNNIYGIDISEQAVGLARLSLFLLTASKDEKLPNLSHRIITGDSVKSKSLDWADAFPDVFAGTNPGFDIIIGNPPYVRQEDLDEKESMRVPEQYTIFKELSIPRQSDLNSYFYYHSICRLRRGGVLGFITSDSWMNHDYGETLQYVMLTECQIATLMKTTFNVFRDADVKTVTVILKREEVPVNGVVCLLQAETESDLQTGISGTEKLQNEIEPGNWNLFFTGSDATSKINMIRMSDAGSLKRGITTGHNGFFVLKNNIIKEYNISKEYLCPIISGGIHEGLLEDDDAEEYLLNVSAPKGRLVKTSDGKNVLKYIENGESTTVIPKKGKDRTPRKISELETMSERKVWYSLDLGDPPAIFLARFADRRMKMYENNGGFHARDNFAYFYPHEPAHTQAFLAYLSSSWFSLYMEKNGDIAGAGALQMLMKDYKKAPVPDFAKMSGTNIDRLSAAWVSYRDDFDQDNLDNVVYDILGIDSAGRLSIQSEITTLTEARVNSKQKS